MFSNYRCTHPVDWLLLWGGGGNVTRAGEETEVLKEIPVCCGQARKTAQLLRKVGLLKIFKLKFPYEPAGRLGIDSIGAQAEP